MSVISVCTARLASGVVAVGLLLVPLSGCSSDPVSEVPGASGTGPSESSPAASGSGTSESSPAAGDTATSGSTPDATAGTSGGSDVDCSGRSCELTLNGAGTEVEVLGSRISLGQVQDGRATIGVGDREVSCAQGESVSAGPLTLECTTVSAQTVTLTASLG